MQPGEWKNEAVVKVKMATAEVQKDNMAAHTYCCCEEA